MADEIKATQTNETAENQTETVETSTPTVEELMAQLAQANADRDKYKSANDKLSKSEAEMKRQLRAKLSDEEKEAEAKRLADEETESLRQELNRIKAVNAYKNISEKTVDALIAAVSEADHIAIAEIIDKEIKSAVKIAETTWMKSRPAIGSNSYSSMTKEQIMAIPDREERQRAIAMNLDLFK